MNKEYCFNSRLGRSVKRVIAFGLVFTITACSPGGMFNEKDAKIKNRLSYRDPNLDCNGLNLSKQTVDASSMRRILACFNAKGSLQPVEDLVNRLSDEELKPLADFANRYLLENNRLLYQTKSTFETLIERGTVDQTFQKFGLALENEEFFSATISLLQDYVDDPKLYRAIERIGGKVTDENFIRGMDALLTLANSKVFESFVQNFQHTDSMKNDLRTATDAFLAFIRYDRRKNSPRLSHMVLKNIQNRLLFQALDQMVGKTDGELKTEVPKLSTVMNTLTFSLDEGIPYAFSVGNMFRSLNVPISCMRGTQEVASALKCQLTELAEGSTPGQVSEFVSRSNKLDMTAFNPFCTYPNDIDKDYETFVRLSQTPAIEPMTQMIRAFNNARDGSEKPLIDLLIMTLTDRDETGKGALEILFPLLETVGTVGDQGSFFDDLLLMITLPRIEDRQAIIDAVDFLLAPDPDNGGMSVYDVFEELAAKLDADKFYRLFSSLKEFVDTIFPKFEPNIRELRAAYYINNVHPYVYMVRDVLSHASDQKQLFKTLIKSAQYPEFNESLRFVSNVAQDGRLKQLVKSTFQLFNRFAEQGRDSSIRSEKEPPFVAERRHNFNRADLVPFNPVVSFARSEACQGLKLGIAMDDVNHPQYEEQLQNFLTCMGSNAANQDIVDSVSFLRGQKLSNGQSFFDFAIHFSKSFAQSLSNAEVQDLTNRWLDSVVSGKFYRILDSLPLFIANSESIIRPLLNLVEPIFKMKPELHSLESWMAARIMDPHLPSAVKFLSLAKEVKIHPVAPPGPVLFQEDLLKQYVRDYECEKDSSYQNKRVKQIAADANEAVNNWKEENGLPQRGWSLEELKSRINPLLSKLADPDQNRVGNRTAIQGMIQTLRYFTLKPGEKPNSEKHYTPDYLKKWLVDRSNDYVPILYLYPGDKKPRLRVMNTLDRLELVVLSANIEFAIFPNQSLKFLSMMAESWGDEPIDVWPAEIRAKYPRCKGGNGWGCPNTLYDTYQEMESSQQFFEKFAGYPELPGCLDNESIFGKFLSDPLGIIPREVKISIYNTRQVIDAVKENLPSTKQFQNTHANAGGMKVLRDIFFELYYSSPEKYRNPESKEKNNLNIVVTMLELGLMRQISQQLDSYDDIDASLGDFFNSVIHLATSNRLEVLANEIVRTPDLFWKVFEEGYSALSSPTGARPEDYTGFEGIQDCEDLGSEAEVWACHLAHFKQLLFYGPTVASGLSQAGSKPNALLDEGLDFATDLIKNHKGFLMRHADMIQNLFESESLAVAMRGMYEMRAKADSSGLSSLLLAAVRDRQPMFHGVKILDELDRNPDAKKDLNLVGERLALLRNSPQYRELKLGELADDLLKFFQEEPSTPEGQLPFKLRMFLAQKLQGHEWDVFLEIAEKDPDRFYQILESFSSHIQNGDLKNFFDLSRRSLRP